MGCSNSKEPVAEPTQTGSKPSDRNFAWTDEAPAALPAHMAAEKPPSASSRTSKKSTKSSKSVIIRVRSAGSGTTEVEQIPSANSHNSLESLGDEGSVKRGVSSAKSLVSTGTCDSGFEAECPGMITEHSDLTEVRKIEEEGRPKTPDLSFSGTKIDPRKSSGKTKPQTGADILGELKSQGLLAIAPTQAQSGMSFEVMAAPEFEVLKRPPPRLAKLKKRKKKASEMTREEVEAKQVAAEQRRKRREAKMLERLNTSAKERQVQSCLDTFVETQRTQTKAKVDQDLDAAAQRREEHFRLLKQKLEDKKKHAAKVRQAKMERLAQTPVPPEDGTTEGGDPALV